MTSDYDRVERAIRFIHQHAGDQPRLEEVAREIGLSPYHFQRLFRRWAGISPKRFLQYLTVERAKELLLDSASVLDAAYEVGLSGPGRLHDHFVSLNAVSPGEFKSGGAGLSIRYGRHSSPFGGALLAVTGRGICALAFFSREDEEESRAWLRRAWPGAELIHDPRATAPVAEQVFSFPPDAAHPLPVLVRGTNFQVAVWKALIEVPAGRLVTYRQLAAGLGRPRAARAVGGAVAANRVAFLVPCHRVIRSVGGVGGYRWGADRKLAMIAWEGARAAAS